MLFKHSVPIAGKIRALRGPRYKELSISRKNRLSQFLTDTNNIELLSRQNSESRINPRFYFCMGLHIWRFRCDNGVLLSEEGSCRDWPEF